MSEITVRALNEDEWDLYRGIRLQALEDAPAAFVADHDTEVEYDEQQWRERMRRSARLVAVQDDDVIGVVSLREDGELLDAAAEVFGLWVTEENRGAGLADQLMHSAADLAVGHGFRQLFCWVGTDNGRAVAFLSSYGFRPTEHRRTQESPDGSAEDGPEDELAMVLALRP